MLTATSGRRMTLAAQLEALLFLAPEPVTVEELADALQVSEEAVERTARVLGDELEGRGLVLRAGIPVTPPWPPGAINVDGRVVDVAGPAVLNEMEAPGAADDGLGLT